MAGNPSYATLAATTLQHYASEIFDNVITNNATLYELKKAGNVLTVSGGRTFTHPAYYAKNATFDSISKYGTIPTDMQDPITRMEYDIKVVAGSVVYSIVEEAMNAGNREKLIDYVESLKMVAESSMSEVMGSQIMQAAASVGADDINSIPQIISSTVSTESITSIGGLTSAGSGNSWWRNYTNTISIGSFFTASTAGGLYAMDVALAGCTYGLQGPTFIVTTKSIFGLYNATLQANVRYTSLDKGNAGFRNLLYATLPVYFDDNCPATNMYFIDGKSLRLQVLEGGNFKMTQGIQAYSQLMVRHLMYFIGNLTCGSRRTNGVISKITA